MCRVVRVSVCLCVGCGLLQFMCVVRAVEVFAELGVTWSGHTCVASECGSLLSLWGPALCFCGANFCGVQPTLGAAANFSGGGQL